MDEAPGSGRGHASLAMRHDGANSTTPSPPLDGRKRLCGETGECESEGAAGGRGMGGGEGRGEGRR